VTAVVHHGSPGSYKTFALVQRVLIPALQAGRVVVTNIRGFNDIDRIRTAYNCDIPDSASIMYLEPDTEGFQLMARFFHWAPAGALIAMDEGQRVYPTRLKSFDMHDQPDNIVISDSSGQQLVNAETGLPICRPATVEIAFDQHRHYNWDIYISTPNIAKIHGEIRKVVEWAYRHRNNSGLLPWYKNTWTEFRHDSEQSGKSISHYSGAPKRYKADPRAFGCYQSTATGTAKNTTENISIFRDPKLRFVAVVFVLAISFVIYNLSAAAGRFSSNSVPDSVTVDPVVAPTNTQVSRQGSDVRTRDDRDKFSLQTRLARSTDLASLFTDNPVYYTGNVDSSDYLFEVHTDKGVHHFRTSDLIHLGFQVRRAQGSFVHLDWQGIAIYAFTKPRADSADVATMERQTALSSERLSDPFL